MRRWPAWPVARRPPGDRTAPAAELTTRRPAAGGRPARGLPPRKAPMIALDLLLDRLPEGLVDEAATKRLRLIGDLLPHSLAGRESGLVPPGIWLEFDAQADVAIPVPGLFTAAAPDGAASADWDAPGTIAEVLHTVGATPSDGLIRQVRRIAEHGLHIRQV